MSATKHTDDFNFHASQCPPLWSSNALPRLHNSLLLIRYNLGVLMLKRQLTAYAQSFLCKVVTRLDITRIGGATE